MDNITQCNVATTFYKHPISGKCVCSNNYHGESCEFKLGFANEVITYIYKSLQSLFVLTISVWIIIYFIYKSKGNKGMLNIATASIVLNLIGSILEMIMAWLAISSDIVKGNIISVIFFLAFSYIHILMLLSSFSFIVGFWVDVLGAKKLSFKMRRGTKIGIIINSILGFILALIGGITALTSRVSIVSIILIVFPIIETIILASIFSIKIIVIKREFLSSHNLIKQRRAKHIFIGLMTFWITYLLFIVIDAIMEGANLSKYRVITEIIFMICKRTISILLMLFFDPNAYLFKSIIFCREIEESYNTDRTDRTDRSDETDGITDKNNKNNTTEITCKIDMSDKVSSNEGEITGKIDMTDRVSSNEGEITGKIDMSDMVSSNDGNIMTISGEADMSDRASSFENHINYHLLFL